MADKTRALVIDDDKIVRDLVKRVVEAYGAEVVTASNGAEARDKLGAPGPFALVVIDLLMPELSGWDVLDALEKDMRAQRTSIIVLTGTKISADEKRKLLRRANAVVNKSSFNLEKFRTVIDSCCVL